ncbi:arylesterase [Rhizobium sp. CFBP 8762]|uniref:arylesterase n=1 Tax=Rhizobium sp. CFBP 8762 TaxID=2775279 RepID=UPI0017839B48|nr:arylesterase [Rhizobium sp. CFBP 8762]MBD8555457.1 arylesterase [Rhizobium sp. CFBP 8762]
MLIFKALTGLFLSATLITTGAVSAGAARAQTLQMVGFGDSLMAGYQLPAQDSFAAKLEAALRAKGHDIVIANAGVSGDTTSGGLARIDWSVPDGTKAVILELGANDALRGIPPEQTEKNLDQMITKLKARGIAVLLVGIMVPPNMGGDFGTRFNPIYKRLAQKHDLMLYPFFLDGVVTKRNLQLDDGMHPNAAGIDVMVERFLPLAERFIAGLKATN